jgi:hypothetical protein
MGTTQLGLTDYIWPLRDPVFTSTVFVMVFYCIIAFLNIAIHRRTSNFVKFVKNVEEAASAAAHGDTGKGKQLFRHVTRAPFATAKTSGETQASAAAGGGQKLPSPRPDTGQEKEGAMISPRSNEDITVI